MLYSTYQAQHMLMEPWRDAALGLSEWLHKVLPEGVSAASHEELAAGGTFSRSVAAASDVFSRMRLTHKRPPF
jgi:poly(3-hydroxybutyrate) depolymerase